MYNDDIIKYMKRNKILTIAIISTVLLTACTFNNEPEESSSQGSTDSSFTGKYSSETSGYVTWYDGADATSVAYYVPELEAGWYHCAVSEPKYSDLPAGTAIELTANNKTIHLLVTDLCPSASNSKHTSKSNYFFDLEKSAFTSLADASVGELDMTFKTIPYPTTKNLKLQVKDGVNEWWVAFRFFNMRYPLKKVEFSQDGNNFKEVQKLSGNENNWYKLDGENLLSGKHYFRLTDIFNQTITTDDSDKFSENAIVDLGQNFPN